MQVIAPEEVPDLGEGTVVILSGAGLSAASGVPTFRGADGLWEGHRIEEVATPEAWFQNRPLVRRFYNERRRNMGSVEPNAGHRALVELQASLGPGRVWLVTQNIDGLIQRAARQVGQPVEVIEMHGSLWHLKCEARDDHPRVRIGGDQEEAAMCARCGAFLRPDVVWFGEVPVHMDRIAIGLSRATHFLSVGTSGVVYPAAGFARMARERGADCIEVNLDPTGGPFSHVVAVGAELALPVIAARWLA
jgi:NAD-dependent deacetylase